MRTLAIVGSHKDTRNFAPWDQADTDFWLFNESAAIGWAKKVDAIFQVHSPPVWKNPMNRNCPDFPIWIRQVHPFPIYMQQVYKEVPSSVKYPLDEVSDLLIPGLFRGDTWEDLKRSYYYTSTVCYALALGIYQAVTEGTYSRIEIHGIEMESDTEYRYQRDGVFFWVGIALGHGIQVKINPRSNLFREPLYGYEGDVTLSRKHIQERLELLGDMRKRAEKTLRETQAAQEAALAAALDESGGEPGLASVASVRAFFKSIKDQAQASADLGAFDGAIADDLRYLKKADAMDAETGAHYFARQEFELTGAQAIKERDLLRKRMDVIGGKADALWKQLQAGVLGDYPLERLDQASLEYAAAHREYIEAAYQYGLAEGAVHENITLLSMVDELIKAAGGSKSIDALMLDKKKKAKRGRRSRGEVINVSA